MSGLEARFWPKVRMTHTCWIWTGATAMGYGRINAGGRHGKSLQAHRVAYEFMVGPIPAGLQLDHLCRNKRCVNPLHLEAVTQRENLLRGDTIPGRNAAKTHCIRGHEFTPDNTILRGRVEGGRDCRTCKRERSR